MAAYQFLGGNKLSICIGNRLPIIESALKTKLSEKTSFSLIV